MAKSEAMNFTQTLKLSGTKITDADTTTLKTLYTAGTEGDIVKSITLVSNDTAAKVVDLYVNDGTTDFLLVSTNVPITSGTTGAIAGIDLLGSTLLPGSILDSTGKRVLLLPATYTLKVAVQATVTATKVITVVAQGEAY